MHSAPPLSPTPHHRHPAAPLRRVAASAAAVGLVSLGLATPAAAHDELLSSSPADQSTLTQAPAEVSLTFSGELIDGAGISNVLRVTDVHGHQWQADTGTVTGATFGAELCPGLPNGDYTTAYRVVYSDGHAEERALTFSVEDPDAPASGTAPEGCGLAAPDAAGAPAASQAPDDDAATGTATDDPATAEQQTDADTTATAGDAQEPAVTEATDGGVPAWVLWAGLAGVAIIAAAAVFLMRAGTPGAAADRSSSVDD
ncbi:MAG: copper resistance protein CopC [Micrococcus sp.]|nr:copper resistance protein CopC [Micrococcus sp.]